MQEEELKKDLQAKLAQLGRDQQERIARQNAENAELPYVNLTIFPIDPEVLELLPKDVATKTNAVVFYRKGKDVRIATTEPKNKKVAAVIAELKEKLRVELQLHVVSKRSIAHALSRYRPPRKAEDPEGVLKVSSEVAGKYKENFKEIAELGQHIDKMSPTKLLATVVSGAVDAGASDLHIEPQEKEARLRYRIDGVLEDIAAFPTSGWRFLLSRVKVLSSLKLNVTAVPQDGSFVLTVGEKIYDIRVSILPGGDGENIVLRILDREVKAVDVTDLGMKARDFKVIERELQASNGMIMVTGPTGSGKTTSLASFIQNINKPEVKVITLENPIEYHLPGVEQTQIDEEAGYTFAKGLRAILRQDPDVIMVGEVRDEETANTAMHAALTGHLVFSTLHTNDAPGAIPRLSDMGVAPNIIGSAINLIIAQRLVRVVCKECAKEYKPDANLIERITDAMEGASTEYFDPTKIKTAKFVKAGDCAKCNNGYKGRVGVFEVMPVEREIEEMILAAADENKIRDAAIAGGMTTIAQDTWLKVMEGVTTVEELERITRE